MTKSREKINNNNELYLHDHTRTYSIAKAMFRNQNYNTGQLRYFDKNLSRTSKQVACVAWRFWSGALSNKGLRGQRNREEIGEGAT